MLSWPMKSRTSLRLACRVAPRLRPSSVSSLECAVAQARLCNSVRINTYKTPRNIHKTPSFKPCICNTYANERRNPFRMNRCTKHGGGVRGLWKSQTDPARPQVAVATEGSSGPPDVRASHLPTDGATPYTLTPCTLHLSPYNWGPDAQMPHLRKCHDAP